MSIGKRLKDARLAKGLTQVQLASAIGVSKGAIGNYENETSSPNEPILIALMRYLEIDANYLYQDVVDITRIRNAAPVGTLVRVPIIGTVKAGYDGFAYEDLEGYDYADVRNAEEYFYLRVEGDSMEPDINEGDLALIHKQEEVDSGDIAVAIVNGDEGTIKKVKISNDSIVLIPFNTEYETRIFVGEEMNDVRFAGKVVETKRKW